MTSATVATAIQTVTPTKMATAQAVMSAMVATETLVALIGTPVVMSVMVSAAAQAATSATVWQGCSTQ